MAVQVVTTAPARQRRLGGIRSVAQWVTNERIGAAEEVVYLSDGCTFPVEAIGLCYTQNGTEDEKTGVGIDTFDGIVEPFALYGGVECWIGPDDGDFVDRARAILEAGEDREVESRLGTWAAGGTALTGVTDIVEAVAALEQHADENYLGRPIILMSRADAVRAGAALAIEYGIDGLPYTVNGTPVVASGLVDSGSPMIVGATTVLRSAVNDIDTVDHTLNTRWAVAEAVYAILVDCNYRAVAEIVPPEPEEPTP